MKLLIETKDFKHIEEESFYNHNYYMYYGSSSLLIKKILEICHEDLNFYEFYMTTMDDKEIFIGCANEGFSSPLITIDFGVFYT